MFIRELTGEQRRQTVDAQQAWEVWRTLHAEKQRRFLGGMRWVRRGGAEYLLRKIGASEKSLGPKSPETEEAYRSFFEGRAANKERLEGVTRRLNAMAPINRAMGLGRMPLTAARIARQCDEKGLLGERLIIVGTNALYAYEALAGVHFESGLVATADIDLLFDARQRMSLGARRQIKESGLIGVLQKADPSFAALQARGFRAANKDGYLVDLIRPQDRNAMRSEYAKSLSDSEKDLEGAEIIGLNWLINSPKVETVVIDERGFPAPIAAIDPRVYALHKLWLSKRDDRSKLKAERDLMQARAVAQAAREYLRLDFNGPDLAALPDALRRDAQMLLKPAPDHTSETPDW